MDFIEYDISIKTLDGEIFGSLLIPSISLNNAVSIILSGSGPTDRNGNQKQFTNNGLMKLAINLAECGHATFRFDKRGIGKSRFPNFKESSLTINHYIDDIVLIVNQLKNDHGFATINLIGHSEGGIIALSVANKIGTNKIILLATPAVSLSSSLISQISIKAPHLLNDVKNCLNCIKNGNDPHPFSESVISLFRHSTLPYMRSAFFIQPKDLIRSLNNHILIIQGDRDLQVFEENGYILNSLSPNKSHLKICKKNESCPCNIT